MTAGAPFAIAEGGSWNFEATDWWEQAKLTAQVPTKERFGRSVYLDGQTAIIGAPNHQNHGAAYVFEQTGDSWTQTDFLMSSDPEYGDGFGGAVSICGDIAVIGDTGDDTGRGAAYVFERTISGWSQTAKLLPDRKGEPYDRFGHSVSVSGTTAIIGARYEEVDGVTRGAAYIYTKTDLGWMKSARITGDERDDVGGFGHSVSLDGIVAVIGAPYTDNAGAVYVFQNPGGCWTQGAKLTPDSAERVYFGESVSISGTTVIASAEGEDHGGNYGSAYIFELTGMGWTQTDKITPDSAGLRDQFGESVSISDGVAAVGAWDRSLSHGSAYVFEDTGLGWVQADKLLPSEGVLARGFGEAISVSDDTIFVGAYEDKSILDYAGAVYVYTPEPATLSLLALGGLAMLSRKRRRPEAKKPTGDSSCVAQRAEQEDA